MEAPIRREVPVKTMVPKMEKHEHKFVPLWMPITAFVLICFAYVYCTLMGIEVNIYREVAAIGISGIFALACGTLDSKPE